jgi:hypothetical protein
MSSKSRATREQSSSGVPPLPVVDATGLAWVEVEEGLETISIGLAILDRVRGNLEALDGPKVVDIAARLNKQGQAVDTLLEPLKDKLKAWAVRDRREVYVGEKYQACIRSISKTVMDTDKIKEFLGRKLYLYQKKRLERQVSFDVKS